MSALQAVLENARTWCVETADVLGGLRRLPDGCVQTCVTSPPYWALRDYDVPPTTWEDGWTGCLGLEPTPQEYVEHVVEVFREVRRVLRDDGTLWLNLGDSYCTRPNGSVGNSTLDGSRSNHTEYRRAHALRKKGATGDLKHKDLVGIPWRVAFALQADGWWLRMDNVWHKPNVMPEPVTDRPTKAHEYVFLLSKSECYYYDSEAVKEPVTGNAHPRGTGVHPKSASADSRIKANENYSAAVRGLVGTRNLRSVWSVATQPVEDAHFATYPPRLVEPCIAAGTSSGGACIECGSPLERVLSEPVPADGRPSGNVERKLADGSDSRMNTHIGRDIPWAPTVRETLGWELACEHEGDVVPCMVLDPFSGAGTTVMEALRQGRRAIGIEIKQEYVEMARQRIDGDNPMFNRTGLSVVGEGHV